MAMPVILGHLLVCVYMCLCKEIGFRHPLLSWNLFSAALLEVWTPVNMDLTEQFQDPMKPHESSSSRRIGTEPPVSENVQKVIIKSSASRNNLHILPILELVD